MFSALPGLLSFERAKQTRLDKLGPQPPLLTLDVRCDEDELNVRIFLTWLRLKQQTEHWLLFSPPGLSLSPRSPLSSLEIITPLGSAEFSCLHN